MMPSSQRDHARSMILAYVDAGVPVHPQTKRELVALAQVDAKFRGEVEAAASYARARDAQVREANREFAERIRQALGRD